jgi:hypothetical protein
MLVFHIIATGVVGFETLPGAAKQKDEQFARLSWRPEAHLT